MADKVSNLSNTRPIVNDKGIMTQEARAYFNTITELLMITGQGSPENVISARIGALYTDVNGSTGSILYVKKLANIGGDQTQGWVLV